MGFLTCQLLAYFNFYYFFSYWFNFLVEEEQQRFLLFVHAQLNFLEKKKRNGILSGLWHIEKY